MARKNSVTPVVDKITDMKTGQWMSGISIVIIFKMTLCSAVSLQGCHGMRLGQVHAASLLLCDSPQLIFFRSDCDDDEDDETSSLSTNPPAQVLINQAFFMQQTQQFPTPADSVQGAGEMSIAYRIQNSI